MPLTPPESSPDPLPVFLADSDNAHDIRKSHHKRKSSDGEPMESKRVKSDSPMVIEALKIDTAEFLPDPKDHAFHDLPAIVEVPPTPPPESDNLVVIDLDTSSPLSCPSSSPLSSPPSVTASNQPERGQQLTARDTADLHGTENPVRTHERHGVIVSKHRIDDHFDPARVEQRWYSPGMVADSQYNDRSEARAESSAQGASRNRSWRSWESLRSLYWQLNEGPVLPYAMKSFPDESIDISILNVDVSAEEILTFFPGHLSWSKVMARLLRNGWDEISITAYINYARDLTGSDQITVMHIERLMIEAMTAEFGRYYNNWARRSQAFKDKWPPVTDFRPSAFGYQGSLPQSGKDVDLVRLTQGVKRPPGERGMPTIAAGPLTDAIWMAFRNPDEHYELLAINEHCSDGPTGHLQMPGDGSNHDLDGWKRRTREIWMPSTWLRP